MLPLNKNSFAITDGLSEQPSKQQEVVVTKFQRPLKQFAPALPKVAILLCTYHGQQYLADQMDSFAAQSYSNWVVWASDDGSQDDTHAILETCRDKWGDDRLSIHFGPAEGFVANFLSLTCNANIQADYYAYSDQDDIWEADKLQRAVDWFVSVPKNVPALYCTRTRVVDADNREICLSPLFPKPPSFANALMQNVGGGNTMVFNEAARQLLSEVAQDVNVITHDWWAYLVVTGCGGRVFYDEYPSLRYRQHGCNLVGMNSSWPARFIRIRMLWQGRFRDLNDRHINALQRVRHKLTPENQSILDQFAIARDRNILPRLFGLKKIWHLSPNLAARSIAELYRYRWQIELFFKWFKQHLRIKSFFGNSENAVKTRIWIAPSPFTCSLPSSRSASISALCSTKCYKFLSLTMFERTSWINCLLVSRNRQFHRIAPILRQSVDPVRLTLIHY